MTKLGELEARFARLGGRFLTPIGVLGERLHAVCGLVCDWDGVFNDGVKGARAPSTYSEADSMGTNLLRYGLWRMHARKLPVAALVTGVENPTAREFAVREHFHAIFSNAKNKTAAIELLCSANQLPADHLLCVFDDVNDLGMAFGCGVRVLVRRDSSPLLADYVARYGLCDYVTGHRPSEHAVREVAELMLGILGCFDDVVASRVAWDQDYASYFTARQAIVTELIEPPPRT